MSPEGIDEKEQPRPQTNEDVATMVIRLRKVTDSTLRYDGEVAFEVKLVPVDHLRWQIVGFGVEVDFKRICHAETALADCSDIFAGRPGHQLFKLRLRHRVYSRRKKRKRRPNRSGEEITAPTLGHIQQIQLTISELWVASEFQATGVPPSVHHCGWGMDPEQDH